MKRLILIIIVLSIGISSNAQGLKFKDAGIVLRLIERYYNYVAINVTDWNNDGKKDIIVGCAVDIILQYSINTGTLTSPVFQFPPVDANIPSG